MDELYDEQGAQALALETQTDIAVGTAATVFKKLLEEMGIDPLDRSDWLGRFIESHRNQLSRNGSLARP